MSQGPENRFIKSIHRLLPPTLHWEKMHNAYRGGTFDVWYSGKKADIWIEYKWDGNTLSDLQKKWGKERHSEGRKVFAIEGKPEGGVLYLTPKSWEEGIGVLLSGREIAAWIVKLTTGEIVDAQKAGTVRKKRGQRIQNTNHGSADIRTDKVQSLRKGASGQN